jgi:hypothetical protein
LLAQAMALGLDARNGPATPAVGQR